jgi:hypothetical protein
MTEDRPLSWCEIYERLARRPDRPDARAWAVLGERLQAWTRDASLADETCAEVWRTFNSARGGASFEGFVQGRLMAVTRPNNPHPHPAHPLAGGGQGGGLLACLEELRARNPNHHRVLALLYEDRATIEEAAERLGVDPWTARSLAVRARMALAQCLERAARQREAGANANTERPPQKKDRRAGRSGVQSGRQQKGRPRRGGRPR